MPTTARRLVVETSLVMWSGRPLGGALSELWGQLDLAHDKKLIVDLGVVQYEVIFSIVCRICSAALVLLLNCYYRIFPDLTSGCSLFALSCPSINGAVVREKWPRMLPSNLGIPLRFYMPWPMAILLCFGPMKDYEKGNHCCKMLVLGALTCLWYGTDVVLLSHAVRLHLKK